MGKRSHTGRWMARLVGLCACAALAAGCTSVTAGSQPDSLQVTMTSRATTPQHWVSQDGASVQQLYQHIQQLQQVPHAASLPCMPARHTYSLMFTSAGKTMLTATTWQCQGYIQLSTDSVVRKLDSGFWQELSGLVGQTLATD